MLLWDVDTGKVLKCFSVEMPLRPERTVISPDGRLAASANWRGSVSLWRLAEPLPADQALTEARQRLEATRRGRGPEDANTLAALHDLGALLWDQGKPDEAEPLFRESLETKSHTLGPDHPETLFALRELAALLQAGEKPAQASTLLRQYVEGSRGTATAPSTSLGGFALGGDIDDRFNSTLIVISSTVSGNRAIGGDQGAGANGGDGIGGGINVGIVGSTDTSTLQLSNSMFANNQAIGGQAGTGGSAGQGLGGGVYVYNLGMFAFDLETAIKKNHASTSNDDVFP